MRMIVWNRSWRCLATGFLMLAAAEALCGAEATPPQAAAAMEKDFFKPPAAARPWVYWFWLNGNLTREGITADLEAMQRVGIGGVLIMEVDQGAPRGRPISAVRSGGNSSGTFARRRTASAWKST